MLSDEDIDPKTRRMKPRALDNVSIDDLKLYVDDLKAEIQRATTEIARKEKSRMAADSFFKTGGES